MKNERICTSPQTNLAVPNHTPNYTTSYNVQALSREGNSAERKVSGLKKAGKGRKIGRGGRVPKEKKVRHASLRAFRDT